jgi:hypothetical protein
LKMAMATNANKAKAPARQTQRNSISPTRKERFRVGDAAADCSTDAKMFLFHLNGGEDVSDLLCDGFRKL